MRIRKGDRVIVRNGKYKGQRAEVVRAIPAEGKVVLEGVNVAKRHAKPTRATMQGGDHRQVHAGPGVLGVDRLQELR